MHGDDGDFNARKVFVKCQLMYSVGHLYRYGIYCSWLHNFAIL